MLCSASPRPAFQGSHQSLEPFDNAGCEWKEDSCGLVFPSVPEPEMTSTISFISLNQWDLVC